MNGFEKRKEGNTHNSEKAVVNLNIGLGEEQFRALSRQIATGFSGVEFALLAVHRDLSRKLVAIATKLEDPTSGALAQILVDLTKEADALEEEVRKHGQASSE